MTVGVKQGMLPRVITGDRDAVLRQIGWCAAVGTLVNCHCKLEENQVGNVRGHTYVYSTRGGATVLKVGDKTSLARKKILYPHIWKSGGTIFYTCGVRASK